MKKEDKKRETPKEIRLQDLAPKKGPLGGKKIFGQQLDSERPGIFDEKETKAKGTTK